MDYTLTVDGVLAFIGQIGFEEAKFIGSNSKRFTIYFNGKSQCMMLTISGDYHSFIDLDSILRDQLLNLNYVYVNSQGDHYYFDECCNCSEHFMEIVLMLQLIASFPG